MIKIVDDAYEKEIAEYEVPEPWKIWSPGAEIWCKLKLTDIRGFGNLMRLIRNEGESGAVEGANYLGFEFLNIGVPGIDSHIVSKTDIKEQLKQEFNRILEGL